MKLSDLSPEIEEMACRAEARIAPQFARMEATAMKNTRRVMEALPGSRPSSAFASATASSSVS